jgi:hypothetical protein
VTATLLAAEKAGKKVVSVIVERDGTTTFTFAN